MSPPDYSKYLISEAPVVFQPTLARILGTDEAIILQQIHWFSQHPHDRRVKLRQKDGRIWVQMKPYPMLNPIDGHLKFMSLRTFRRKIASLKESGVLLVEQLEILDTTNWYSIDMQRLNELEVEWQSTLLSDDSEAVCQVGTPSDATNQNGTTHDAKLAHPPVPQRHQPSDKVARSTKVKELESTEDVKRYDLLFDSLEPDTQKQIDEEAAKRLAMLGPFGQRPEALTHMRRHILRERGAATE